MIAMEAITKSFLKTVNSHGQKINELSVVAARKVLTDAQSESTSKQMVDTEEHLLSGGPKGPISIRIYRPKGETDALPVVMYFHGGGWVLGDKNTHDRLMREIAIGTKAAVIFVNFTRSPEVHYPIANEEAYFATKYIGEHGHDFNLDSARLAVAGDSAGGNMAAAVTMMAKSRGGPDIQFQVLLYPVTDANFNTESYRKFAKGYFLTREAMEWFWKNYLPDKKLRKQSTASPLQASIEELKKLPPALIITGELDVLRDEGEAYARKLLEAGVRVTAVRYLGATHDFMMLNALAETSAARSATALVNQSLQQALSIFMQFSTFS